MIWVWVGFVAFVLLMLALDLGVFHRKAHVVCVQGGPRLVGRSGSHSGLAFAVFVYFGYENHWLGLGTPDARRPRSTGGTVNDGATAA